MTDSYERPSWDEWGLDIAKTVATRADCRRLQVAAVIVRPDRTVVSTGYNGGPARGKSCLKGECPRGLKAPEELPSYDAGNEASSYELGPGACIAVHAEANALMRASWDEMCDSTIYVTHEPCAGCRRLLLGSPLRMAVWPEGRARIVNGNWLVEAR